MDSVNAPILSLILEGIRSLHAPELIKLFNESIPLSKTLIACLDSLNEQDQLMACCACLLAWYMTGGKQVPRQAQLESCLATFNGKDSLVYAGTGSGKTLPIALNILLEDLEKQLIAITISPLKQLQITQVCTLSPRLLFSI